MVLAGVSESHASRLFHDVAYDSSRIGIITWILINDGLGYPPKLMLGIMGTGYATLEGQDAQIT